MNVIWIVADTFRRDHIGAYGNARIVAPSLAALADDPAQDNNLIDGNRDEARELHRLLVQFMRETRVPARLLSPGLKLKV